MKVVINRKNLLGTHTVGPPLVNTLTQLTWVSCVVSLPSITSTSRLYEPCDRCKTSILSPTDVHSARCGPCGEGAQHLPRPPRDNAARRLLWQAAGYFSRTEPAERSQTKAGDVGGFSLSAPQKPQEEKEHFLPPPQLPLSLASFPPLRSLQQTEIQ